MMKNRTKKLLSILLVVALLFSLAACGEKNDDSGKKEEATSKTTQSAATDGALGDGATDGAIAGTDDSKKDGEGSESGTQSDSSHSKANSGSSNSSGGSGGSSSSGGSGGGSSSGGSSQSATISVSCGTVLNNMGKLDPSKKSIIPSNGVIMGKRTISISSGETAFDALLKATKAAGIQMEHNKATGAAYIEGIANLYEFDCGELSGWEYRVNGTFPGVSCSAYKIKNGDTIEFLYTCDLGRDIGNNK